MVITLQRQLLACREPMVQSPLSKLSCMDSLRAGPGAFTSTARCGNNDRCDAAHISQPKRRTHATRCGSDARSLLDRAGCTRAPRAAHRHEPGLHMQHVAPALTYFWPRGCDYGHPGRAVLKLLLRGWLLLPVRYRPLSSCPT